MSFASTLPYSDPGQFKGGIRTREAVLRNLQAEAFRSASQNQVTDQAANSQSGATATNTRAQTANLQQDVVSLNSKFVRLESHEQVLRTPLAYHDSAAPGTVIDLTTDLNSLNNSDGTFVSNTATAGSINGDQASDAHLLQTGDIVNLTGAEFDGTSIGAFSFVYGAGENGTTVGDLINYINGTGIGTDGNVDKFTTATLDLIGPGDEHHGKLRLVSDNGGPGMLAIDLDAPDAHVTSPTNGTVTNRVGEIITGSTSGIVNNLITNAGINDGDVLSWSGTDSDGSNFGPTTFTVNNADGNFDGLDNLLAAINADVPDNSIVSISGGRLRFTAEDAGDVNLALTIANDIFLGNPFGTFSDGNTGGVTGENAFSSFTLDHDTAATNVIAGTDLNSLNIVDDNNPLNDGDEIRLTGTQKDGTTFDLDFVYGAGNNGTTVGELVDYLNGAGIGTDGAVDKFSAATVSLTAGDPGTIVVLEDANSGGEPVSLDLNVLDEGKHINLQDFQGPPSPDLLRHTGNTEQSDFLARGSSHVAQNQGGDQSALARLNDFAGSGSTSFNTLTQNAAVTQTFDVDLTTTVLNCTLANGFGAFHGARFREHYATDDNNSAQAIFTNGQRQGSAAEAIFQTAVADGGDADNIRTMNATISQTGDVRHTGVIDMTRKEIVPLTPRGVDILARYQANSAQNTSAASQEQVQVQSAAGGVDGDGSVTENGGTSNNQSNGNLFNQDTVTVANIGSIMM